MIYLDYSANTPAEEAVLERFLATERDYIGNPNSAHLAGREAKEALDRITRSIAASLSVQPEEIIYTSGASEANNLAIKGIARTSRHYGRHIISTPLEHASVSGPLTYLQEQGYEIDLLDIGRDGRIDPEHLKELLRDDTVLVAVCAVDSELGTIQPIAEIAEILKAYPRCRLHVDATQAIGKIPFSFQDADTVSLAAHKFYGLNGSGLLIKRSGLVLEPLIHGGVSHSLYRSGTPTLALAAALDTALTMALSDLPERNRCVAERNARLREGLSAYPKVSINSPSSAIPHILNLSVSGVKGREFQQALDRVGVCVSVKSACSVENTPSRAVFAVSRDRQRALASWRISLSHRTTQEEIETFLRLFDACYQELTSAEGRIS
jgi:cysteine desulfurase